VLEFDGQEVQAENVSAPTTKFFIKNSPVDEDNVPWKKQFDAIYSRASNIVSKYTIPFTVRSLRWLPVAHEIHFIDDIQTCQTMLSDLVERFNDQYLSAKQQVQTRVGDALWDFMAPKLPMLGKLAPRFSINILPMHIAPPETNLTIEDLRSRHDVITNAIRGAVENSLEDIIREPRKELVKTITAVNNIINTGGRLNTRSFNAVKQAIEKLRAFNFMVDGDVESVLRTVEENINEHTPKEIMDDAGIKSAFSSMLTNTVDTLSDEMRINEDIASFGRSMRVLDLS
jgi:hypothetical protein